MSYSIITSGLQMIPASQGGALSPVGAFTIARQGNTTNGVSDGTQNKTTVSLSWSAASGPVDHHQIQRSTDFGPMTDFATVNAAATSFTDTTAANIYNSDNIGEGGASPGGQTTIYNWNVLAVDSLGNRGPAPSQLTMPMYLGAPGPAWSAATTYRVGDVVSSGGTNYFCWIAHTNSAPPSGNWQTLTGGNYCSGIGDLSFGGNFVYTDTTGAPVGGGTDILCTNTAGNGLVCGLQFPTGTPAMWNYGAEIGWANYFAFDFKPTVAAQQMDFAIFSRGPPGDVASRTNLGNFTNSGLYGPIPQVGVWGSYKIPLSAHFFTTSLGGITTFTGSITAGVLAVSAILSGPGIDPTCWIAAAGSSTTTGATAGVWVSSTPGQSGAGNYNLTMGTAGTPPNVSSSTMTCRRTNFYKTALKNTTGNSWWVNNPRFLRS